MRPGGLGNPGPGFPGVRSTPGYQPTPNSEPVGYQTGAPPRTRMFSLSLPAGTTPIQIIQGTPENRIVILTAPNVAFTIFIGNEGVDTRTGFALPAGLAQEIPIVGLQDIYAVTDAPVPLRLQVIVSSILLAERQRQVGF